MYKLLSVKFTYYKVKMLFVNETGVIEQRIVYFKRDKCYSLVRKLMINHITGRDLTP